MTVASLSLTSRLYPMSTVHDSTVHHPLSTVHVGNNGDRDIPPRSSFPPPLCQSIHCSSYVLRLVVPHIVQFNERLFFVSWLWFCLCVCVSLCMQLMPSVPPSPISLPLQSATKKEETTKQNALQQTRNYRHLEMACRTDMLHPSSGFHENRTTSPSTL